MRPDLALDVIRPIAMRWVAAARAHVDRHDPLVRSALETNFAWKRVHERDRDETFAFIASHLESIDAVLRDAERLFRVPTAERVREFFGDAAPPAYAWNGFVWFTEAFRSFGPNCRTAMVVHESVHVFDERSGEAAIHVSEWDEPKFSAIPPALQIHNPSAYASYAAQLHERALEWPRDVRYGAGRPND
jgi:hypothetical protein